MKKLLQKPALLDKILKQLHLVKMALLNNKIDKKQLLIGMIELILKTLRMTSQTKMWTKLAICQRLKLLKLVKKYR